MASLADALADNELLDPLAERMGRKRTRTEILMEEAKKIREARGEEFDYLPGGARFGRSRKDRGKPQEAPSDGRKGKGKSQAPSDAARLEKQETVAIEQTLAEKTARWAKIQAKEKKNQLKKAKKDKADAQNARMADAVGDEALDLEELDQLEQEERRERIAAKKRRKREQDAAAAIQQQSAVPPSSIDADTTPLSTYYMGTVVHSSFDDGLMEITLQLKSLPNGSHSVVEGCWCLNDQARDATVVAVFEGPRVIFSDGALKLEGTVNATGIIEGEVFVSNSGAENGSFELIPGAAPASAPTTAAVVPEVSAAFPAQAPAGSTSAAVATVTASAAEPSDSGDDEDV